MDKKKKTDSLTLCKMIAVKHRGRLVSRSYHSTERLVWECKNGHQWKATRSSVVNQGTWCAECAREKVRRRNAKESLVICQKIAISRGGQLISKSYRNNQHKLKWKCGYGHYWRATRNAIVSKGTWCLECLTRIPKNTVKGQAIMLEKCREVASERGGNCLSKKYVNSRGHLNWTCENGHVWSATYSNVIYYKTWCPKCGHRKSPDAENTKRKKKRQKITICRVNAIAKKHGGKCLTKSVNRELDKVELICKEGHRWETSVRLLLYRNTWCRKCTGIQSRTNLVDAKGVAESYGGNCLSRICRQSTTPLNWKCGNGHRFIATVPVARRFWCTTCAIESVS